MVVSLENDAALRSPSGIYWSLVFLKADFCCTPSPQFSLQNKYHNTSFGTAISQISHRETCSVLLLLADQGLKKYLFLYFP